MNRRINISVTVALSALAYHHVVKPLFFRFTKPEQAHKMVVKAGRLVQAIPGGTLACRMAFNRQRPEMLEQHLLGHDFKGPVGLAGGFDKNIEVAPFLESLGFAFIEGGSVTNGAYEGNPQPWYHRLPKTKSIMVHAGMPNHGVNAVMDSIENTNLKVPLSVSVGTTNGRNFTATEAIVDVAEALKRVSLSTTASMVTINISCPNMLATESISLPNNLEKLLVEVDKINLHRPILIKMPLSDSWEDLSELLDIIVEHKVDGVILANLESNHVRAADLIVDEVPSDAKGGLSGSVTERICNEYIRRTYAEYGDKLLVVGVGGIFGAEQAYTKIRNGASLVQLITGFMFTGPQVASQINLGLAKLLKRDGFTHISQAIGVDVDVDEYQKRRVA